MINRFIALISLFLFLGIYSKAVANEFLLKEIKLISSPSKELEFIVKQLNRSKLTNKKALYVINLCEKINQNYSKLSTIHFLFLLKSELYKSILNKKNLTLKSSLEVNSDLIKRIDQKLKLNKVIYAPFTQWLYFVIRSDLEIYLEKNFIDQYQLTKRSNLKEKRKAKELKKILTYHSPWLSLFALSSPTKMNTLATELAIKVLEKLSKRLLFYKDFTLGSANGPSENLFSLPDTSTLIRKLRPESEDSTQADIINNKKGLKKVLETIESSSSKEDAILKSKQIDNLMDELPTKKKWTPKDS